MWLVSGDSVSLETQNGLLELLAFYGLGNPWEPGKVRTGVNGDDVKMVRNGEVEGEEETGEGLGKNESDEEAAIEEEMKKASEDRQGIINDIHVKEY